MRENRKPKASHQRRHLARARARGALGTKRKVRWDAERRKLENLRNAKLKDLMAGVGVGNRILLRMCQRPRIDPKDLIRVKRLGADLNASLVGAVHSATKSAGIQALMAGSQALHRPQNRSKRDHPAFFMGLLELVSSGLDPCSVAHGGLPLMCDIAGWGLSGLARVLVSEDEARVWARDKEGFLPIDHTFSYNLFFKERKSDMLRTREVLWGFMQRQGGERFDIYKSTAVAMAARRFLVPLSPLRMDSSNAEGFAQWLVNRGCLLPPRLEIDLLASACTGPMAGEFVKSQLEPLRAREQRNDLELAIGRDEAIGPIPVVRRRLRVWVVTCEQESIMRIQWTGICSRRRAWVTP